MGHTFTNHLYHIIFSTKDRRPHINRTLRARLLPYIGGVVINVNGTLLEINAIEDHVHMLARIPADIAVAKFVGTIKANSSKWVSATFPAARLFSWQAGYSSFTVSESNWRKVAHYIASQQEHHQKLTFQEELAKILRKHGIQFDGEHYLD